MKYKLLKELEDAGFPKGKNWDCFRDEAMNKKGAYVPTLEELIEACGDGFDSLDRMHHHDTGKVAGWVCNLYTRKVIRILKTKEEAVAELWLTLKK